MHVVLLDQLVWNAECSIVAVVRILQACADKMHIILVASNLCQEAPRRTNYHHSNLCEPLDVGMRQLDHCITCTVQVASVVQLHEIIHGLDIVATLGHACTTDHHLLTECGSLRIEDFDFNFVHVQPP